MILDEQKLIDKVILRHNVLVNIAIDKMSKIKDPEHNYDHMQDVVRNTARILINMHKENQIVIDTCIIGAYWHDVGRLVNAGIHEEISANLLKEEMEKLGYANEFIQSCYESISQHKWSMKPKTFEGLVVRDADKLSWLGIDRWGSCIKEKQELKEIMNLLPRLRNEILYFEVSKTMYDKYIVELVEFLYKNIFL